LDRARRLRDGRPQRVRGGRHRPGGLHGLRVRLRARTDRDGPTRDRRDQDLLRRRRALPRAVLMLAPLSWIRDFTLVDAPTADLGLGDDHSGTLALESSFERGADVRDVLGLDDVIFDLAITPNRPDAMCIVGGARELAAHFRLPLEVPEPHVSTDASVTAEFT